MKSFIKKLMNQPLCHEPEPVVVQQSPIEPLPNVLDPFGFYSTETAKSFPLHKQPPRATVLLIDVSPSMSYTDYPLSRLYAAQNAAIQYCRALAENEPDAAVALISFSYSARVESYLSRLKTDSYQLETKIRGLQTSPSTNIGAGLSSALYELSSLNLDTQKEIILLTDGENNRGSKHSIHKIANELKSIGTSISTIGIGGSPEEVDERLLKQIASTENGQPRYWFIDNADELQRRFQKLAMPLCKR